MEDFANFARLIEAIRSWLGEVVIVGGWAHRLHRFHPLATAQEYQPLRTRDVDLAFSPDAPLHGDLRKALRKAGFREELSGEDTPPVTHYRLGEEDAGFYAEFLTAKKGSGVRRDGKSDSTVLALVFVGFMELALRWRAVKNIPPRSRQQPLTKVQYNLRPFTDDLAAPVIL
jgi:hypothetical protein